MHLSRFSISSWLYLVGCVFLRIFPFHLSYGYIKFYEYKAKIFFCSKAYFCKWDYIPTFFLFFSLAKLHTLSWKDLEFYPADSSLYLLGFSSWLFLEFPLLNSCKNAFILWYLQPQQSIKCVSYRRKSLLVQIIAQQLHSNLDLMITLSITSILLK